MDYDEVPEITSKEFDNFVKSGLVLIDFWASWCMPCLMMEPIINELNEKFKGKIKFARVNIDSERTLAHKYNVRSIPNFALLKNGQVVQQFVGAMPRDEFEKKLKNSFM